MCNFEIYICKDVLYLIIFIFLIILFINNIIKLKLNLNKSEVFISNFLFINKYNFIIYIV